MKMKQQLWVHCCFFRGRGGHGRWLTVKGRVARVGGTAGGSAELTARNKKMHMALLVLCWGHYISTLFVFHTRRFWRQTYFQRAERLSLLCRSCENG